MTDVPTLQPEPDEPRDVRVARALGWTNLQDVGTCWIGMPPGYPLCRIPDFECDPAFILRVIEAHKLKVYGSWADEWWSWYAGNDEGIVGEGKSPSDAVLSWIEAAYAAGIPIKTEMER